MTPWHRILAPYLLLACLALAASFTGTGQNQTETQPSATTPSGGNTTTPANHTSNSTTPTNATRTSEPNATKSTAAPVPTNWTAPTYTYQPNETHAGPAPSPSPPPKPENYSVAMSDQRVPQDVWISGAERVDLRNVVILGRLGIAYSQQVTLTNVEVSGDVTLQGVQGADIDIMVVGGSFGFQHTRDFSVDKVGVGRDIGCVGCANGVYRDVLAGGQLIFKDNVGVDTSGIKSVAAAGLTQPTFATPAPDVVKLNVTNTSVSFRVEKDINGAQGAASGEARLDVSTTLAVAHLAFTPPDRPGTTAVELESRFEKLQEFEDRDGDGAYDLGDLVVREYLIEDLPVSNLHQERLGGDRPGWQVRVDYALPPGGTFSLIYTAYDASGEQTKIDIEIVDYAYATASSRLALQVRLASASDWRIDHGAAEDRLVFLGRGYDGFFSWIHTAQADGVDTPVTAQVLEEHRDAAGQREIVLFLGYARAQHLVHDPSIGVLAASVNLPIIGEAEVGNVIVYTSTLIAAVVVLWAMGKSGRKRP